MKNAHEILYTKPSEQVFVGDEDENAQDFYTEDDILDAMVEFAEQFKPKWFSVEERLPESSEEVLGVMQTTLDIYICFYRKSRNLFEVYGLGRKQPITDMKVAHWMPLPELPTI